MPVSERPKFGIALAKFRFIYGDGDLASVGEKIGGKVKYNIDLGESDPLLGFTNGCAIRMSYVLNHVGIRIPYMEGKVSSGAHGKWYLFRVRDLISFLSYKFGDPDKVIANPNPSDLKNRKGLLIFDVDVWSDATGHVTLWDGIICSDSCYFPQARQASFWEFR